MLNRDSIRSGIIYDLLHKNRHITGATPKTDEERAASLAAALAAAPAGALDRGSWVFGYGSLLWNPAFHFVERRRGRIYGYHRSFCIWAHMGRGSPENPGLMLALDRGGSCSGVALRIAPDKVTEELSILWAREMAIDTYVPVWVAIHGAGDPVYGLAFTIDRRHPRYAGRLPAEVAAAHLARAEGYLGTSADYLANTVTHLDELGIHDATLTDLHRRVTRLRAEDR